MCLAFFYPVTMNQPHRGNKKKKTKTVCPILASRKEERKQAKLAKKQQNILRHENRAGRTTPVSDTRIQQQQVPSNKKPVQKVSKKKEEEMKMQRVRQVRQQLKADDKVIKQMEKKLKLNRRKGRKAIPKSFYADGLGDLLDLVDKRVDPDQDLDEVKDEGEEEQQSDDSDQDMNSDVHDQESDHGSEHSDQEFDQEIEFDPDSEKEDEDEGVESDESDEEAQETIAEPPAEPIRQEPEQLDQTLLRRIRGQLNRITTSNMPSICSFIGNMYRENSLFQMNESICRCMDSLLVIDVTLSPLKLVTEMCLLLAALHENIGEEVGGHAMHYFVKKFKAEFDSSSRSMESKKLDNVIAIICNLYATGVMDSGLMYEIVSELVTMFDEKSIELLLFILTAVGFLMRKDSPDRMKSLIRDIQSKSNTAPDVSKRTEFMLETLTEIKNNNILKVTSRSSSVVMPIDRDELKSILRNCLKQSTKVTPIPATLQQVLTSNRWWIKVGPGLIEDQEIREAKDKVLETSKVSAMSFNLESESEERLCRKLRLNTTTLRRSLFKAVISSSDYIEAADRLASLCNKSQCIEAANVVIQISIHETKKFNPFYFHVLKRLASFDRRYKLSIFFAIKDRLTEVSDFSEAKQLSFATLIFHLIKAKVISLAVVKGLDFASLTESLVQFMTSLLQMIMDEGEEVMREVFDRIPKKDHMLLTQIRLFISCFMDKANEQSLGRDLMNARIKSK